MQINKVTETHRDLYLPDDPNLLHLTDDELRGLKEEVLKGDFVCSGESFGGIEMDGGCGHTFNPYQHEIKEEKKKFIKKLFGRNKDVQI